MTLLDHAHTELAIASREEDMAVEPGVKEGILQIIKGFSAQGHSGGSAAFVGPRVAWIVGQLLAFEPITPLTGADDEWVEHDEELTCQVRTRQNRRCGDVFQELHDGVWVTYRLDRVVWTDRPFGKGRPGAFVGWDSARRITFPYDPGERSRYCWRGFRIINRTWARLNGTLRP